MSYTKLIHDYLEGELNRSREQELFSMLSMDEALRHEFGKQVKMQQLLAMDSNDFSPPIEYTNGVFSSLGFNIPTEYKGDSFWKRFYSKAGKVGTALFVLLLLLPVSAGLYYVYDGYLNKGNGTASNMNNSNMPVISSVAVDETEENGIKEKKQSALESRAIFNNTKQQKTNLNKSKNSDLIAEKKRLMQMITGLRNDNSRLLAQNSELRKAARENKISGNEVAQNNNPKRSFIQLLSSTGEFAVRKLEMGINDIYSSPNGNVIFVNDKLTSAGLIPNPKFTIEAGRFHFRNSIPDNIDLDNTSGREFVFSFNYNVNQHSSLGIKFGRSCFYQKFKTDESYTYYQNPELYWIGATYSHFLTSLSVFDIITPYVEVLGGATSAGPLVNGEAGVEVSLGSGFYLNVGAHGSWLFYNVDGRIYKSDNVGLSYGLNYKF